MFDMFELIVITTCTQAGGMLVYTAWFMPAHKSDLLCGILV